MKRTLDISISIYEFYNLHKLFEQKFPKKQSSKISFSMTGIKDRPSERKQN